MKFRYAVYLTPKDSNEVINKKDFGSYDEAVEYGKTWEINGFAYCIVEHT